MVYRPASRYAFSDPCVIDSMGGEDVEAGSPRMFELQIRSLTTAVVFITVLMFAWCRITEFLVSVRIDTNTDDATVSVVDIESNAGDGMHVLSVPRHMLDANVVEEE